MSHTAALVTCRQYPRLPRFRRGLTADDRLLINPLKKLGIKAVPAVWDAEDINWKQFDIVIIRSTWDYHLRVKEFLAWLKHLKKQKVNLWNPPAVIEWNINKKYLFDLEKKGIPIIPTVKYRHDKIPWHDPVVFKPEIGASSYLVSRLPLSLARRSLGEGGSDRNFLVQPYIKEIESEGEFRFIYINSHFTHCVLMSARAALAKPAKSIQKQADLIFQKLNLPALYAGLDLVNIKGKLHVMEIELIEPRLFFKLHPPAASLLARAIKYRLKVD